MIPKGLLQSARVVLTTFYLLLILVTIPISFQVGGLYCGLSFTVTLFNLYLVTTTLKIAAGARGLAKLATVAYYAQHFFIPSLLFLFLSGFSHDELKKQIDTNTRPDESLVNLLRSATKTQSWIFYYYYYQYVVRPWQYMLLRSTPYFTLLEGFFTVLGIQAVGETNRWLSRTQLNSNSWVITGLMASGGVITAALYYLYRIYVTPIWELDVQTASLLGFTFSIVCGLGIYGIVSGRGSTIESSLFFAYIVRCLYEISPQLATSAMDEIFNLVKETWQNQNHNLRSPDSLLAYYRDRILTNGEMVWDAILEHTTNVTSNSTHPAVWVSWHHLKPVWNFAKHFTSSVPSSIQEVFNLTWGMAKEAIAPAVVINLCFRILIFYSATRIIPALQKKHKRRSRRFMRMLYLYSPCIVIAMYTHLILQYSGQISNDLCLWGCFPWSSEQSTKIVVDSWGFWNWCNIFCTMAIYASELFG
ncbi:LANO_0H06392g1_1 [Lachancea nothofagi CBS 11611]|uniref:LANO_0H06392g1_1 n=1 Tax=Lachancea nothofagi CBS 11611 TaxID=1266666 RepID=A0A1G4KLG8_9SACH|nr:LANO_0H06392g1_1 [Lachancea nothofagi CBS 11611]